MVRATWTTSERGWLWLSPALLLLAVLIAGPWFLAHIAGVVGPASARAWNIAGFGALLLMVLCVVPVARQEVDSDSRLVAGLVATAALIPISVAEAITVIVYIVPLHGPGWHWAHSLALLVGSIAGLGVWWVWAAAAGGHTTPALQNARIYAELRGRYDELKATYDALPPEPPGNLSLEARQSRSAARETVRDHLIALTGQLGLGGCRRFSHGLRWVLATGYINAWYRLHRGEEALIMIRPLDQVLAGAFYDEMRLQGSDIPNSDSLLRKLHWAVTQLSPQAAGALTALTLSGAAQTQTAAPAPAAPAADGGLAARSALREVRRAIEEYRDAAWDGLVRQRNHILESVIYTRLAAYVLLAIVILLAVPRRALLAAAVFYLVGAIVGLFKRLRPAVESESQVEDYGLATAALIQTPLFSGLAAIGGVALTALLLDPILGSSLAPSASHAVHASPTLSSVFNLNRNRGGLVVAAIFGLTPELLITRLLVQAKGYKKAIGGSEAAQTTKSG